MRLTQRCLHGVWKCSIGTGQRVAVGTELLPMEPSNDLYFEPTRLRQRLDEDGYLYFKNVIPRKVIDTAVEEIAKQMLANGWTTADARQAQYEQNGFVRGIPFPKELFGEPPPRIGTGDLSVQHTVSLPPVTTPFEMNNTIKQAMCGPSAMAFVRQVFGNATILLPHYELELSPPGEPNGFICPSIFTGRGTRLLLSVWVPLHDTELSAGPPIIVRGSNSHPLYADIRTTYGSYDIEAGDIYGDGCLTHDAGKIINYGMQHVRNELTGEIEYRNVTPLVSTAFEAGDILLSTCYTLKSYLTNCTNCWRVSGASMWIMDGDDIGPDPRFAFSEAGPPPGLEKWMTTRNERTSRPRSMHDARKQWKILEFAPPLKSDNDAPLL